MLRLNFKNISLAFCLFFALTSCDKQVIYEKNTDLENAQWQLEDTLVFETKILDTKAKNLYLNFRHDFDFNWRNIWLDLSIKFPNDSTYTFPVNIPLSQPNGEWFGESSGNLYLIQFPIEAYRNYSFSDTGNYVFSINHQMRELPLQHALSAGIRIENTVIKN